MGIVALLATKFMLFVAGLVYGIMAAMHIADNVVTTDGDEGECFKHCVAVNSHSHSKLADRRYLFSREPLPFENKSAGIVHNLTVYRPGCSELAHSCLFFIR